MESSRWTAFTVVHWGLLKDPSTLSACSYVLSPSSEFAGAAGRVTVAGIPTPRQFVELVVSVAYPEHYQEHRLNESWRF